MSALDDRPFPKAALIGAGALVLASVALVSGVRVMEILSPGAPRDALQTTGLAETASARLRFESLPDGAVRVSAADDGRLVRLVPAGADGFIHGALRGMRRVRAQAGLDPAPVLTVTRWSNGRVTVSDPAVDFHLDLSAFGADNKAAFEALLLAAPAATPEAAP